MVVKIRHPHHVDTAIYYNEHKVEKGVAELLYAHNFLKDAGELTLVDKKQRFGELIALNRSVKSNAFHTSVNFSPDDKVDGKLMVEIAIDYMERIGFGDQPYLVYRHTDSGHPHVHIVSTSIQGERRSIDMNYLGKRKSNPARIALQDKYGLVKAEERKQKQPWEHRPIDAKVEYGKAETKRQIANILNDILLSYRYRSLPELNAILRFYNIRADPGQPGSRIHQHRGLMYQALDETAKPKGVPLKASSFPNKPGMNWLETKYRENKSRPSKEPERLRAIIDQTITNKPATWEAFVRALAKERIIANPYINKDGFFYGLSFVDLAGKQVFKASELGKPYSVHKILNRLGLGPDLDPIISIRELVQKAHRTTESSSIDHVYSRSEFEKTLRILFRQEYEGGGVPHALKQKAGKQSKSKRKKRI